MGDQKVSKSRSQITTSSTAEYFSKNLQQVGFSSLPKAVLTTLKEAVDNSLDACDDAGLLPEVVVEVEKCGPGSLKNSDRIRVSVEDNGPGIPVEDLPKVFGEYLASSKFGRGRCSRGQQGIGISAATTWAQLTSAQGAVVLSKTKDMRKAIKGVVEVDIKHNKGVFKNKESVEWEKPHGLRVEFVFDGRVQLNGEGGLLNYLQGTTLVNPHLILKYKLPEQDWQEVQKVTQSVPVIPEATAPHPHTMKLGEFIAHSHLFGRVNARSWLKKGFSRITDSTILLFKEKGMKESWLNKSVDALTEIEFKEIYTTIQNTELMSPSTKSVMMIGEDGLSKSVQRLGTIDFFSVVTRRPTICDFKPVVIEVAIGRFKEKVVEAKAERANEAKAERANEAKAERANEAKAERASVDGDAPALILRFANRVPLQFDKSSCAIVKAIESVNWRAYGLNQPKGGLPQGSYVIAVSVVSPFIKFKNASKETIDASDELVEEMRRALIRAGQRLSRHIRHEDRASDLEEKLRHIEQFCPILVEGLCRITKASEGRKKKAEEGLVKILGRDAKEAEKQFKEAQEAIATPEHSRVEPPERERSKGSNAERSNDVNTTKHKDVEVGT